MILSHVIKDLKLAFIIIEGDIAFADIIETLHHIESNADFAAGFDSLTIIRDSEYILPAAQYPLVAQRVASVLKGQKSKAAVVTGSYTRIGMIEALADRFAAYGCELKGFSDISSACRWLNVDASKLPKL